MAPLFVIVAATVAMIGVAAAPSTRKAPLLVTVPLAGTAEPSVGALVDGVGAAGVDQDAAGGVDAAGLHVVMLRMSRPRRYCRLAPCSG